MDSTLATEFDDICLEYELLCAGNKTSKDCWLLVEHRLAMLPDIKINLHRMHGLSPAQITE